MSLTQEDLQAMGGVISEILEVKLKPIEQRLESVELTLENVTNRNIAIIAEGHLDLSRKLDEALKVENEKEMLIIRVNSIENELRKIKAKLETIA